MLWNRPRYGPRMQIRMRAEFRMSYENEDWYFTLKCCENLRGKVKYHNEM